MDPTDYSNLAYAPAGETPEQRAWRLYARNMQQQGTSTAPIQSPWQGVNRMVQAGLAGWFNQQQPWVAPLLQQLQQPNYQWSQPDNVSPLS